jgi:uncharacterized membrane protein
VNIHKNILAVSLLKSGDMLLYSQSIMENSHFITHATVLTKRKTYNYNLIMDVLIKIKDREGVVHELQAPTDMAMNIMEL